MFDASIFSRSEPLSNRVKRPNDQHAEKNKTAGLDP